MYEIRELTFADALAARNLSEEAFGMPTGPQPDPEPGSWPAPGHAPVGAFDGDALVGQVVGRAFTSWFGGAEIPTWGIAGVTVRAEARGQRLLRGLFDASFTLAAAQGMALSALYPTAQGIYRPLGYERVGAYVVAEVPTTVLAGIRAGAGDDAVSVRRCGPDDLPALRAVFDAWASRQHGTLGSAGLPRWASWQAYLGDASGVTAAVADDGTLLGFCRWSRGSGWGPGVSIAVDPLVWTSPPAGRALLRFLGSFRSVAPAARVRTSPDDPTLHLLPSRGWTTVAEDPSMVRLLDVRAAIEPRRFAPGLSLAVGLSVVDEVVPGCAGDWTLELAGGHAQCRPGGGGVRLTPQGLALLYTAAQPVAALRTLGLAEGGEPDRDRDLDAIFAGPGLQLREYF